MREETVLKVRNKVIFFLPQNWSYRRVQSLIWTQRSMKIKCVLWALLAFHYEKWNELTCMVLFWTALQVLYQHNQLKYSLFIHQNIQIVLKAMALLPFLFFLFELVSLSLFSFLPMLKGSHLKLSMQMMNPYYFFHFDYLLNCY